MKQLLKPFNVSFTSRSTRVKSAEPAESVKVMLNAAAPPVPVPGNTLMEIVGAATLEDFTFVRSEPAIFDLTFLANSGTAAFLAGLIAGPVLGLTFRRTLQVFFRTC